VNRKGLVKTSRTPGRTQLVNFFLINQALSFVDLPGYGYAKVPVAVQKKWGPMIERYLSTRETLKGVLVLMDVRRTPGAEEMNLFEWLDFHGIPVVPILTKADKFSRARQQDRRRLIAETLGAAPEDLILFSAKSRQGRDAVWETVAKLCEI
jgi:GTP-binding protein